VHEPALAVSSTPRGTRSRWGALLLAVAGVLFLLYPAVRPWHDESTVEGATRAMSSGAWVAAHLFAMVGSTLVALGLLAVWNAVSRTRADRLALAAVVIVWIGVGLTLPYFGAEDFGLNAIARKAAEGQVADLLGLVDAVRFSPVPATTFAVGLLLLGAGAVLAALAIWRSGVLPRSSGILFAAGFVLFLPQFFMPRRCGSHTACWSPRDRSGWPWRCGEQVRSPPGPGRSPRYRPGRWGTSLPAGALASPA
jgi:succinate dehydrogenase hydrophobic anchor subunit